MKAWQPLRARTLLLPVAGALVTSTTATAGRCRNRKERPEVVDVNVSQASSHDCGFAPNGASLFIHYSQAISPTSAAHSPPKSFKELNCTEAPLLHIRFQLPGYYTSLEDVVLISRGVNARICISHPAPSSYSVVKMVSHCLFFPTCRLDMRASSCQLLRRSNRRRSQLASK